MDKNIFDEFPLLITKRLKLRKIKQDDAESIFSILSNPDVINYDTFDLFTDIKQAFDLINWFNKQYNDRRSIFWGISLIDQSELIGFCKCEIEIPKVRVDLGYDLNATYWNKGFMTESLNAVIDFVFHSIDVNRIEATVSTKNLPSIKVLQKLNFIEEGILRERCLINEIFHDMIMFSILKSEYLSIKK
jgi:ribosomal-protein-alanine N-acetyltransferase